MAKKRCTLPKRKACCTMRSETGELKLLKIREVAEQLRLSSKTGTKLISRRQLIAIRIGQNRRIKRRALKRHLTQCERLERAPRLVQFSVKPKVVQRKDGR